MGSASGSEPLLSRFESLWGNKKKWRSNSVVECQTENLVVSSSILLFSTKQKKLKRGTVVNYSRL